MRSMEQIKHNEYLILTRTALMLILLRQMHKCRFTIRMTRSIATMGD